MATPHSVAFHTLGCKLNYAESSTIKRQFEAHGFQVVPFEIGADITVINTCSVTDFADRKCRKAVRSAIRANGSTRVVVIGCYAQLKPDEIAKIDGVDLVLGADKKFQILDYIDGLEKTVEKGWVDRTSIEDVVTFTGSFSFGDRTRSFLKIQDGCDYHCSFCTIPLARGRSRSPSIQQVIDSARKIVQLGKKEIVLTGVNIGDFGHGSGSTSRFENGNFFDLIQELDRQVYVPRIRISSIEPNLCSDAIIDFVATSGRFMPHFHMPLQSGNDNILKAMQRRYRSKEYRERVDRIRGLIPHACIGADVIVGFPGETDADFRETLDFMGDLELNYIHAFTYSERANTKAASLEQSVPMQVRRDRNKQIRHLSEKKRRNFYGQHLSTSRPVLFENDQRPETLSGYTDNYIKVRISSKDQSINDLLQVHLSHLEPDGVVSGVRASSESISA
ncbi:MAG: tRNA (N(6)-L-threonylcarbamoyladenosine(37)-C(2))-methylthiotransferase MtaB [Saprospiraceae bacterium]|nr:tRNA (N(6)-L-threonylcarbamoyladenosine(37)-C(2))-methylthiotransferase MtaB [Saprospiraceae bacterium]